MLPEETLSRKRLRYMPDATIYDAWELSDHRLTGRSYLYSLPPIGIGTPMVESLTGYIQRLAASPVYERCAVRQASHKATSVFVLHRSVHTEWHWRPRTTLDFGTRGIDSGSAS